MTTLSPATRWVLVAVGVTALGAVTAVGLRLHDVVGPVSLDVRTARPVFDRIWGVPVVPAPLARSFQRLGDPPQFALALAALAAIGIAHRDRLVMWASIAGPVVAELLSEGVGKPLVNRTAFSGGDAYPSGHTTAMTSIGAVLVLMAFRRWGWRGLVWGLPVGALLSFSMVMSVVRLHSHVMSDALAGVGVGVGTVALVVVALDVTLGHRAGRRSFAAP